MFELEAVPAFYKSGSPSLPPFFLQIQEQNQHQLLVETIWTFEEGKEFRVQFHFSMNSH